LGMSQPTVSPTCDWIWEAIEGIESMPG